MTDAIEHLGWDLWQCARGWTSLFVAEMHAQGYTDFSLPRANVLAYVQRDGSSRAVDIANATGLTKQAVNQTLDELVDCGLIERLPDPSDGRAKRIAFTPRGDAFISAGNNAKRAIEQRWLSALPPAQRERALATMRALSAALPALLEKQHTNTR